MNILEFGHDVVQDELELGLRAACALYVENRTDADNFISQLQFQYRLRR